MTKVNKRIEDLEREIIELKIKQHTQSYIHIPKLKIGLFLLFILSIALTIGYSFIFVSEWNLHDINFIFECVKQECNSIKTMSLGFIPHLFFAYFLISLVAICSTAMVKGSFKELNKYKDDGLLFGLLAGLLFGLFVGLFVGLLFGLLAGLLFGLLGGLLAGLLIGLIGGLIFGLFVGLFVGLQEEFQND